MSYEYITRGIHGSVFQIDRGISGKIFDSKDQRFGNDEENARNEFMLGEIFRNDRIHVPRNIDLTNTSFFRRNAPESPYWKHDKPFLIREFLPGILVENIPDLDIKNQAKQKMAVELIKVLGKGYLPDDGDGHNAILCSRDSKVYLIDFVRYRKGSFEEIKKKYEFIKWFYKPRHD